MKCDFLKGVEGFCLAGYICLCNLSIARSLAHSKSSQHVSDWKSFAFGSHHDSKIIAALWQIMSLECCCKCKERCILKCNIATARLPSQYLLIEGWTKDQGLYTFKNYVILEIIAQVPFHRKHLLCLHA